MILGFKFKQLKVNLYFNTVRIILITLLFLPLTTLNSYFGVVDIAINSYGNPYNN